MVGWATLRALRMITDHPMTPEHGEHMQKNVVSKVCPLLLNTQRGMVRPSDSWVGPDDRSGGEGASHYSQERGQDQSEEES